MIILTITATTIFIITSLPVIGVALGFVALGFKGLWDLTHSYCGYDSGSDDTGC